MSDGNRYDFITFGWIATIIGLLLFGALGSSYRSGEHQSSYYAERCAREHPDSPMASIYPNPAGDKKTDNDHEELPKQPDWCDLAAQHSVAESTTGMHWAAWAGVASGIGGIFIIWQTLVANSAAVAQASRANDIAERTSVAERRAWLDVEVSFNADMRRVGDGLEISLDIHTKNHGSSPALRTRCDVRHYNMTNWRGVENVRGERIIADLRERTIYHPTVFPSDRKRISGLQTISSSTEMVVLVAIAYEIAGSDELRFTCKSYMLAYKRPDGYPGSVQHAPDQASIPGIAHEFGSFAYIT
jgi:hypothetical protein